VEKHALPENTESEAQRAANASDGAAILFYGDWEGHPEKQLKHARQQIYELERQFDGHDCSTVVIHQKSRHFLSRLSKAIAEGNNLRIIHYTGHARSGLLDVGRMTS
jgi:hypothetical protein